jgi:hypothetical protein
MTTSQAHAICKDKRSDGIVQQLGQYQLLESYLELCCQDDPDGTFVFETHDRSTNSGTNNKTPIFKRLYIASSATQKAWEHTLKLIVVDGTFMKAHIFDQTVLLAVAFDGNNKHIILAYAIVTSETEANWVWFQSQLLNDFSGPFILLSDYSKGVESDTFQDSIKLAGCAFSRCVQHMLDNAETALHGIKGKPQIAKCVYKLARARTKARYEHTLQRLRDLHATAAEWFHERHQLFSSFVLLEKGFCRFETVNNNACESSNNAILLERHYPLLKFCCEMNRYINAKFCDRRQEWNESEMKLSTYALECHETTFKMATRLKVEIQQVDVRQKTIIALVSDRPMEQHVAMLLVKVQAGSHTVSCPCLWTKETGRICWHALAAIYRGPSNLAVTDDPYWYALPYHVTELRAMYESIPVSSSTLDRLVARPLVPERCHKQRGAKTKKRKTTGGGSRMCKLCGEIGHYNCTSPNVTMVIAAFAQQAVNYLRGLPGVKVDY